MSETSAPLEFIYDYADKESVHKYLRLTIIVCMYIFVRSIYSNWAKQKAIRNQLEQDKREKEQDAERKEQESTQKMEKLDQEAETFGWGKATRRNVKKQEQRLQATAEELQERYQGGYDAAEDHDIDDLLEE